MDNKARIAMIEMNLQSSRERLDLGEITAKQYKSLEKDAKNRIRELKNESKPRYYVCLCCGTQIRSNGAAHIENCPTCKDKLIEQVKPLSKEAKSAIMGSRRKEE
jgi:rubrerythrin